MRKAPRPHIYDYHSDENIQAAIKCGTPKEDLSRRREAEETYLPLLKLSQINHNASLLFFAYAMIEAEVHNIFVCPDEKIAQEMGENTKTITCAKHVLFNLGFIDIIKEKDEKEIIRFIGVPLSVFPDTAREDELKKWYKNTFIKK